MHRALLITLVTLLVAAQSHADVVTSIQFIQSNNGTALAPKDVAGVTAVDHWNSVQVGGYFQIQSTPSGGEQVTVSASNGLVDSTGAPSGIGYTLTSYGNFGVGAGTLVAGANGSLLSGGAATSGSGGVAPLPVVLKIAGLDPVHTYKLIVYTSGGPDELTYGSLALTGGSTYYFQSAEGDGSAGALKDLENNSSTTDAFASTPAGSPIPNPQSFKSNYVQFASVSGSDSATLTLTELGAWPYGSWAPCPAADSHVPLGIAGIQVVDLGPPSPSPAH